MSKLLTLSFLLAVSCYTQSKAQSCCVKNASDFQLLAKNDDFKASHLAPEPFEYTPESKSVMLTFETVDSKPGYAYYVPSDEPTNNVLLIFHEWWGLNDYIKREAERWQKMLGNVDVYAVDLYDGKVAADPAMASQLSTALDPKRADNIIKGVLRKVGNDKMVATLGWCMGGTWSFNATLLAGNKAAGCVMYYGFPEKDQKKIDKLKADVLYIWGVKDKFITREVVTAFGEQVETTQHDFDMHSFNAVHAFANPSNPNYDATSAGEAEGLAVPFLKRKLSLE